MFSNLKKMFAGYAKTMGHREEFYQASFAMFLCLPHLIHIIASLSIVVALSWRKSSILLGS